MLYFCRPFCNRAVCIFFALWCPVVMVNIKL